MSDERSRHRMLGKIFEEVSRLPERDRTAALVRLCGSDASLRAEAEALLASDSVNDFLDDTNLVAGNAASALPPNARGVSDVIEGYRVLSLLGEGGMGSVYEAEQERPKRRVALKVIRAGLADEAMRQRFYREADALGRLKHPGVAQIYEVGIDEAGGLPFIAMELVEGVTLTEHAEQQGLAVRDRLTLAVKVCEAVEHAHQRGVIHRDLKPANILVDKEGQPKVLDFGVSRMTENDVNAVTMQTQAGQVIGTAAYMSPEQASGDRDAVDTRSDVYSLGVVIFELLARRLPIVVDRLPLPDAIRAIRETEPTRIGSLDTSLRGDVDTILTKALERDPERRYQTASELAAEIRRHLADEPIVAHPPSTIYMIRKFTRRNRALVSGVAAVSAAVMIGFSATGLALAREASALDRAEASLDRASESGAFLRDILLALDPAMAEGRDTELLTLMLERAEHRVDEEIESPSVQAEVLTTIGRARYLVFDYEQAAATLERAYEIFRTLDPDDPALEIEGRLVHADAYSKLGDHERARELLREAMDAYQTPENRPDLAQATRQLGEIIMLEGDAGAALELYRSSLELAAEAEEAEVGRVHLMIGMAQRRLGEFDDAEASYQEALRLFRSVGAQVEIGMTLSAMGLLASNRGDHERSIEIYQEALAVRTAVDPRPNPQAAVMLANIGRMMNRLERYGESEGVLRRSLDMHIEINGPDHYTVGFPSVGLGEALSGLGRHDEAFVHLDRGVELICGYFGEASERGISMLSRRVSCLLAAARYDDAIERGERCLALIPDAGVDTPSYSISVLRVIADAHAGLGDTRNRRATLERALTLATGDQADALRMELESLDGEGLDQDR